MENTHVKDFTQGNITRQLVIFAWPLFLSNLLQIVYNMADMVIVGHILEKTGTSAVSVGGDVATFLTFIAMGFSGAGQVLIAKYIGARQVEKLGCFVGTMGGFLMFCALTVSVTALIFQNAILHLMNTPAEAYAGAAQYSGICMAGLVFIYGYNIVSAVLRGMGDSKHPFVFIAIAAVMNVVLDKMTGRKPEEAERKLVENIQKWQNAGYAFTYKVFHNVGHGGLIAEHTEQSIEEVKGCPFSITGSKEIDMK